MMKVLSWDRALAMGYSPDKRKRRRQHRRNARELSQYGGGTCAMVANWNRQQARLVRTQPPLRGLK